MNSVKLLHIKCCFFQFFNSPVALKKKYFCPPKKKLKWRPCSGGLCICYLCYLYLYLIVLPRYFLLFRKDFRSGNSFQLSPFAWPSRLTLKLNVTSRDICLRDICHFCLYMCYRNDFLLFRKVFGSGNSFLLYNCHLRDSYIWPWNSGSRHAWSTWHLFIS